VIQYTETALKIPSTLILQNRELRRLLPGCELLGKSPSNSTLHSGTLAVARSNQRGAAAQRQESTGGGGVEGEDRQGRQRGARHCTSEGAGQDDSVLFDQSYSHRLKIHDVLAL
jgi:hypothetical protein